MWPRQQGVTYVTKRFLLAAARYVESRRCSTKTVTGIM